MSERFVILQINKNNRYDIRVKHIDLLHRIYIDRTSNNKLDQNRPVEQKQKIIMENFEVVEQSDGNGGYVYVVEPKQKKTQ